MDDVCYHQSREEAAAAGTYRLQHLEEFFFSLQNLGGRAYFNLTYSELVALLVEFLHILLGNSLGTATL